MSGHNLSEKVNQVNPKKIAIDSMERYSGSGIKDFSQYLIITNFPQYVDYFAKSRGVSVVEGSTFKVAHSPKEDISILDFKMGSPMAALVLDLCAYLPIKGILMLGMAGGLRDRFEIGDYFVPVGSIRGDGTSDFYFPPEVPALANFAVQRVVTEVLEKQQLKYHLGITHTTNRRFWEFDEEFKQHITLTRPQAIEMECATLFIASYKHKLPLGALLLISDIPLRPQGIKTKESAAKVFADFTQKHVETGVLILRELALKQQKLTGIPSPDQRELARAQLPAKTSKKIDFKDLALDDEKQVVRKKSSKISLKSSSEKKIKQSKSDLSETASKLKKKPLKE